MNSGYINTKNDIFTNIMAWDIKDNLTTIEDILYAEYLTDK